MVSSTVRHIGKRDNSYIMILWEIIMASTYYYKNFVDGINDIQMKICSVNSMGRIYSIEGKNVNTMKPGNIYIK